MEYDKALTTLSHQYNHFLTLSHPNNHQPNTINNCQLKMLLYQVYKTSWGRSKPYGSSHKHKLMRLNWNIMILYWVVILNIQSIKWSIQHAQVRCWWTKRLPNYVWKISQSNLISLLLTATSTLVYLWLKEIGSTSVWEAVRWNTVSVTGSHLRWCSHVHPLTSAHFN